ncbi:MAG: hypothetical protein ABIK98_05550 [Pseudomonadota bacterium]|uniref:Uncharacterized protein n=1 Tax=Candidatus Desulfatibia profunda TaxID=2841695 RepID=A0A8J6NXW9_9BACT|nr:hypothetical protein [Candidatus Desulfatibia profunda]MBL7179135.1 hypothetical protein [Desulfobacterales bacterium]
MTDRESATYDDVNNSFQKTKLGQSQLTQFARIYAMKKGREVMRTFASLFAAGISVLFLVGCAATYPGSKVGSAVETPAVVETKRPGALPGYLEYTVSSKMEEAEVARRAEELQKQVERSAAEAAARREVERKIEEAARRAERQPARVPQEKRKGLAIGKVETRLLLSASRSDAAISKQVSPEFGADAALLARREAYHKELKKASYTFNPRSPIKVATRVTVYFWLDPLAEPIRLAEELKAELVKVRPGETPKTEAGRMDWSPKMRATLTGEDFDIIPTEGKHFDGLKNLSATRRTEWSWDVKAKHVGQQLPLHLRVWAVLPQELGEPYEVLKLDKLIHVEVTFLWLVNEWEKYWKWILGGLGTALAGAIGAWWKSRQPKAAGV